MDFRKLIDMIDAENDLNDTITETNNQEDTAKIIKTYPNLKITSERNQQGQILAYVVEWNVNPLKDQFRISLDNNIETVIKIVHMDMWIVPSLKGKTPDEIKKIYSGNNKVFYERDGELAVTFIGEPNVKPSTLQLALDMNPPELQQAVEKILKRSWLQDTNKIRMHEAFEDVVFYYADYIADQIRPNLTEKYG